LSGIGVHVGNIIGVLPNLDQKGYPMIGSDGGAFAFGDATFAGSVPGLDIHLNNVVSAIST
jgi:hypothetical protein